MTNVSIFVVCSEHTIILYVNFAYILIFAYPIVTTWWACSADQKRNCSQVCTIVTNCVLLLIEVAEKALTKCITDKEDVPDTQSGHSGYQQQLVNDRAVFYDYEFIEDYCDPDHDESGGGGDSGGRNTPSSSHQFQMQTSSPSSHAQNSNQVSSDNLAWLIDPNDEKSLGTSSPQGTDEWSWRPKKYIPFCLPLTLMVCLFHAYILLIVHNTICTITKSFR